MRKISRKEYFLIMIFLIIFTFVFLIKSPLHPWKIFATNTDSSVFKTVALMISKGDMPYRDSFDHKGPLIYLINLLGMKIARYRGVWALEFINLFITFLFMYKIARIKSEKIFSFISLIIASSLLFDYFEGGNLTEEYAMFFISISLYIYLDYFINQKITITRLIICGLCFGAVCLLRLNMISLWIVFSIAVLFFCKKNNCLLKIKEFIFFFFIGFLIVIFPIILWLIFNNSFKDFIFDYIYFNIVYTSPEGGRALISAKWNSFFVFLNKPVVLFSLISALFCCKIWNNENIIYKIYVVYLICTLLLICLSGMTFAHYGMILIPAMIFPIASFCQCCSCHIKENRIVILILIYWLGNIALPNWLSTAGGVLTVYENRNKSYISEDIKTICEIINSKTSDDEVISVYGNWDIIYVLSNRKHATKFSYQFPIGTVMPALMDEYIEELNQIQPAIIVIQEGHYDKIIENYLAYNNYSLLWSQNQVLNDGAIVYQLISDERVR